MRRAKKGDYLSNTILSGRSLGKVQSEGILVAFSVSKTLTNIIVL
jgi:hypothetical protein